MRPLEFLKAVVASDTDACIDWPFATERQGYGVVRWQNRQQPAHRVALAISQGVEPIAGMDACHKPTVCHNRLCVNPRHLEWGSRRLNRKHMVEDGTVLVGERNVNAKLTEAEVRAIRSDPRTPTVVGLAYGIHPQTVGKIKRRQRWAHVA